MSEVSNLNLTCSVTRKSRSQVECAVACARIDTCDTSIYSSDDCYSCVNLNTDSNIDSLNLNMDDARFLGRVDNACSVI